MSDIEAIKTLSDDELQTQLVARRAIEKRKRDELELQSLLSGGTFIYSIGSSSDSSSGLDALATAATKLSATSTSASSTEFVLRTCKDFDDNEIVVGDKKSHMKDTQQSQATRRWIESSRWPAFSEGGGKLMFNPISILSEVRAQAQDHYSNIHLLNGASAVSGDFWLSTAMYRDIQSLQVITEPRLLELLMTLGFISSDYKNGLSLFSFGPPGPGSHSFDKLPNDLAKIEIIKNIKFLEKTFACIGSLSWRDAVIPIVAELEYGRFSMRNLEWLFFEFHEALCKFRRILERRIMVDDGSASGNLIEFKIKSVASTVEIFQKCFADIDVSKVREDFFHEFLKQHVVRADGHVKTPTESSVVGAGEAALQIKHGCGVSQHAAKRREAKEAKEASKAARLASTAMATSLSNPGPPAVSRGGSQSIIGVSKGGLCVKYLAETSNLFPGLACTFGALCRFKHEAVTDVTKKAALSALEVGGKKLDVTQEAALKVYVETNCT